MNKNQKIILAIVIIAVIIGAYFLLKDNSDSSTAAISGNMNQDNNQQVPDTFDIQGLNVDVLQRGDGEVAKAGDTVTVNYVGTLENGTKFDSSIDRGQPFEFTLGQNSVIQGWELGVTGMKVGEKRKLTIPPELGYGANGAGGVIPPNATLIFEVDMLGIN